MPRSAMPGDGTSGLARFASAMLARGWSGLVSVEVLSADLRKLPVSKLPGLHTRAQPGTGADSRCDVAQGSLIRYNLGDQEPAAAQGHGPNGSCRALY